MSIKTTYSDRLREAMEESAFFSSNGGQTRLAEQVNCRPQAISQVLNGASKELSAGAHSRACSVLGIEALWLADGVGPKYRPANKPSQLVAESEPTLPIGDPNDTLEMVVSSGERALLLKLRLLPRRGSDALRTIVDAMARAPL
jgi:hypothetical protein